MTGWYCLLTGASFIQSALLVAYLFVSRKIVSFETAVHIDVTICQLYQGISYKHRAWTIRPFPRQYVPVWFAMTLSECGRCRLSKTGHDKCPLTSLALLSSS
ncbi:hypothetical protein EDD18DRAFT_839617 [Armillaria luteobubalina]|uniref:Uncharacterized protein n=1 Tax=Armillaria luteobubalina TaxID=153913 RepID=A0AA39PAS3_9AGAR|nr:hypothetical protein EDD18DRAFT_839617 [Armillaria luteobubalina]